MRRPLPRHVLGGILGELFLQRRHLRPRQLEHVLHGLLATEGCGATARVTS
jgi:hypothetical protein